MPSSRRSLEHIVATLPSYEGEPLQEENVDPSFFLRPRAAEGYVWPDVRSKNGGGPANVILITAPGAMGKTAAAVAIAESLNATYIDLSRLTIGSHTFIGLLTRVLGWSQAPSFIRALREGKNSIVLDALDEAQLRSGRDNAIAFLEDLAELIKGSETAGQVILLGRPDSMETAYLVFSESQVPVHYLNIAPLTQDQAGQLIDCTLDKKLIGDRRYDVHRTHPVPMRELRDAVFLDMAIALGVSQPSLSQAWPEVEGFLGYPPVLLVLAERLAVENPAAEITSLVRPSQSTRVDRGELLRRVVEEILDREHKKVSRQIAGALSLSVEDPRIALLYTRDEQCLRILEYAANAVIDIVPPAALEPEERAIYEDQLRTFVPDHPFLVDRNFANAVFADYLRAYVSTSPLLGAHGLSKVEILASCNTPGPFLANFVHALAVALTQSKNDQVSSHHLPLPAYVDENLVDDLIKSLAAASSGDEEFLYSQGKNAAALALSFGSLSDSDENGDILIFGISNSTGVLSITSPLAHGTIATPYGVVISALSDEIELGPRLNVIAGDIELIGKRLSVVGGESDGDGGVELFCTSIQHDGALTVSTTSQGSLKVTWPDMWHIWRPYAVELPKNIKVVDNATAWQLLSGVRRILTSFRHAANDPSANADRMNNVVVGRNSYFAVALAGLVELGVVEARRSTYALRLAELTRYGIDYSTLRSADFAESLGELMSALVKTQPVNDFLDRGAE